MRLPFSLKLIQARDILLKVLKDKIHEIKIVLPDGRVDFILKDGIRIIIIYNDFEEYSYNIIYSKDKLDRKRFDNYDDRWDISTNPHHFHPRYNKEAIDSPMIGDPTLDMYKFIKEI